MKHVVRHRNNFHKACPKEFPASEVSLTAHRTAALRLADGATLAAEPKLARVVHAEVHVSHFARAHGLQTCAVIATAAASSA